jgi:hypothetical protein
MKNKSGLKGKLKTLLTYLNIAVLNVRLIRSDDAGKDMTMKSDLEISHWALSLSFLVLRNFPTIFARIRSISNGAGLEGESRDKIWEECVVNVAYLSNIISIKSSLKWPIELLFGEWSMLYTNIKTFGNVRVVTTKKMINAKLSYRGKTCKWQKEVYEKLFMRKISKLIVNALRIN